MTYSIWALPGPATSSRKATYGTPPTETMTGAVAGNPSQLWIQAVGVLASMVYSGVVSLALLRAIAAVSSLRADDQRQGVGLDVVEHGEEAYTNGEGAILVLPPSDPVVAQSPILGAAAVKESAGGAA